MLVADDNAVNRELARAILEPAGVEVSEAADGLEAVEAASRAPFDAILMDLRMPGQDGHAALAAIRSRPGPNQHMPIVAFLGRRHARPPPEPRAAGFQGVVHASRHRRVICCAALAKVAEADVAAPMFEEGPSYAAAS